MKAAHEIAARDATGWHEFEATILTKAFLGLEARLDFLKSKGVTAQMITTSDKPEPYLAYVIKRDSELCDMQTLRRMMDAERERDALLERCYRIEAELQTKQDRLNMAWAELAKFKDDDNYLEFNGKDWLPI